MFSMTAQIRLVTPQMCSMVMIKCKKLNHQCEVSIVESRSESLDFIMSLCVFQALCHDSFLWLSSALDCATHHVIHQSQQILTLITLMMNGQDSLRVIS